MAELGLSSPDRGSPSISRLRQSAVLPPLQLAYQHWRLQEMRLKVFPTFAASAIFKGKSSGLDILPDMHLSAGSLSRHLLDRRIDFLISSDLDLAGELIQHAYDDHASPFHVVPLFRESLMLSLNPQHPLSGLVSVAASDCREFPSGGYPDGIAPRAAEALSQRGLWKYSCKQIRFNKNEWQIGMLTPNGLCYKTSLMMALVPECRDLLPVFLDQPLEQVTSVVMLKEIAGHPAVDAALLHIQRLTFQAVMSSCHPVDWLASR